MPEPQDPDGNQDDGTVGSSNVQRQREHIKSLEAQLKDVKAERDALQPAAQEAAALKDQLAGFQKSAAFDRLNIPPTGAGKLFRDTYQGDLTDEAVLTKAAEYGIVQAQPSNAPTIPGIDQAAWARQQAALNGTNANPQPSGMDLLNAAPNEQALLEVLEQLGVRDTI